MDGRVDDVGLSWSISTIVCGSITTRASCLEPPGSLWELSVTCAHSAGLVRWTLIELQIWL